VNHLKCAAFELPIAPKNARDVDVRTFARGSRKQAFCINDGTFMDARGVSANTSACGRHQRNFVIIDITGSQTSSASRFFQRADYVHEKAIYLHGGEQYHVEHLDFKERKAT